jgi:tRNA modification GTPase
MNDNDTIASICSGVGSAITIVRISGRDACKVGNKVWKAENKSLCYKYRRQMLFGKFYSDGDDTGETALAVYMPAPQSYTGENVIEIHAHGGAFNARRVIDEVVKSGARQAAAGEFTYRAFINGKLDLTQAEAVADLISANSSMAMHLAEKQMDGVLGRKINFLRAKLINILVECESRVDFPEEELDFVPVEEHIFELGSIIEELNKLYETRIEGSVLRDGIRVVIAGRPNSGKSSLLNSLLGYDRAITTDIPGTTRDTLEEIANIRGIPVKLIDTAGVRSSKDPIEEIGVNRTLSSLKRSQVTIWLLDASVPDIDEEIKELEKRLKGQNNVIVAWNKMDIVEGRCNKANGSGHEADFKLPGTNYSEVRISVKENTGIRELLDMFEKVVWNHPHLNEPEIAVSARHVEYLQEALTVLPDAVVTLENEDWELASVSTKAAVNALGSIIGEDASLDIYKSIFSKFCIGK